MNIVLVPFIYNCPLFTIMRAVILVILALSHVAPSMASKMAECDESAIATDDYRKLFLHEHNVKRHSLAKGEVLTADQRKLQGSARLFKFSYDCRLESLAKYLATDCNGRIPAANMSSFGRSENYYWTREVPQHILDSANNLQYRFADVVNQWWYTLEDGNIGSDVLYTDEKMKAFANMAYKGSTSLGCYNVLCQSGSTYNLATACVYSTIPKSGESLYSTAKTNGCTKSTTCRKEINNSECILRNDTTEGDLAGLCRIKLTEITVTTAAPGVDTTEKTTVVLTTDGTTVASTAAKTTVSSFTQQTTVATTVAPSSSEMTKRIRNEVVRTHNDYRSFLAEGSVRNGKPGKPNLPTATNMLTMEYNLSLETEAQALADNCAPAGLSPNPGENTYVIQSTSVSASDAIKQSMEKWWDEIYSTSVGKNLRYTLNLQSKPNAPTRFTQMAWADTYGVGCGIKRCSTSTYIVCRYHPP
ncbi:hypothetical protein RB195_007205 [Necator americanus]|uniref:SCP domain-containing protein n=1 Tax=Necator americanus TaxID=51031 RepID=A0ABR1BYY7_NECAM